MFSNDPHWVMVAVASLHMSQTVSADAYLFAFPFVI